MDEIELECPKCTTWLSLDLGFAGGVCRCSNCGTLMTVPADPSSEKAEEVVGRRRPARPGTPASSSQRPASPSESDTSSAHPESPEAETAAEEPAQEPTAEPESEGELEPIEPQPPREPKSKGRSKRKSDRRSRETPTQAPPEDEGEQVLVTKSGRKIRIASASNIPTAQKSKKVLVRTITAAIFLSILLVVIAAGLAAIYIIYTSDAARLSPAEERDALIRQTFPYKPNVNPVTIDKPNIIGFPIRGRTFVLVDASEGTAGYLPVIGKLLGNGLSRPDIIGRYDVGYINADGLTRYNGGMRSLDDVDGEDVASFLAQAQAGGQANLADAMAEVAGDEPQQLIVITNRPANDAGGYDALDKQIQALKKQIKDDPVYGFTFDVLMVDTRGYAWSDLAKAFDGNYSVIPLRQLQTWQSNTGP